MHSQAIGRNPFREIADCSTNAFGMAVTDADKYFSAFGDLQSQKGNRQGEPADVIAQGPLGSLQDYKEYS